MARPGNSSHSTKAKGIDKRRNQYRNALKDAVSYEEFVEIVKAVAEQAKGGDVRAAKIIFEYMVGRPDQAITVDTKEGISIAPIKWVGNSDQ